MIMEIELGIVAAAAVVMVVFLVPVLIRLRRTAEESERLLRRMHEDLPVLVKEATRAVNNANQVVTDLREGAARARMLGEAMGEFADTIIHVRRAVRVGASSLLTNFGSLLAGFRAAYGVFRHKASSTHNQEGGGSNGG
jgi:uncharacterized protein YoxC